jgi:transcriptional regulator with XRE-family HTH domain
MDTDFIHRIKMRLQELGLSPRAASLKAGLNDDAIRNIFRGRSRHPRYDTIAKIARVLDCEVQWLLNGDHPHGEDWTSTQGERANKPPRGPGRTQSPAPRHFVSSQVDADIFATLFDEFSKIYKETGTEITTRELTVLVLDECNEIASEIRAADSAEIAAAVQKAAARLSRFLRTRRT